MKKVEIKLELTAQDAAQVMQFVAQLETGAAPDTEKPKEEKPKEEKPKEEKPKEEKPKEEKPKEDDVSDNAPTITDVRKALAKKVATHRDEIKERLTDLGAPNVTSLDPKKYLEFFKFLESL